MARKPNRVFTPASETERIHEAAGLVVTHPLPDPEPAVDEQGVFDRGEPGGFAGPLGDLTPTGDNDPVVEDYPEPTVSTTAPNDPNATIAACLLAVGRAYNDLDYLSRAISKHLPKVAAEPELHAFLMRVQGVAGEFRHAIDQIERGLSEQLRDAIAQAVAA